ncbi:hypothetical protein MHU86_3244 [Fragilaria crotonensis]|nr:hypothetical protein MHU86_3244 [Fragilaria crotonensis]
MEGSDEVDSVGEQCEKRLNAGERHDVTVTLDHLSSIGAAWARTSMRLGAYKGKECTDELHHAEDYRIYEKRSRRSKRKSSSEDAEWDIDHGDTIHPVAFMNARLSTKRFKTKDIDGANLSVDTTVCDVSIEEAPVALLNHCWQRAVHLASNPIQLDDGDDQPTQPESTELDDEVKYSTKKAIRLCESLKLDLAVEELTCLNCHVQFDSTPKLHRHYYGLPNQRGCCWRLIERKNHELMGQALQAEVTAVSKQVCQILGKTVFRNGLPPTDPLSWEDVLNVFASLLEKNSKGQVADTIQLGSDQLPLCLNSQVVEAVRRRLLDRYSAGPR